MKGQLLSPQTHSDPSVEYADLLCPTELDARASAPPILLNAILTALSAIPLGAPQFVRTRMQPTELVRALAAHGVSAESTNLPDGSWRTLLRRVQLATSL